MCLNTLSKILLLWLQVLDITALEELIIVCWYANKQYSLKTVFYKIKQVIIKYVKIK